MSAVNLGSLPGELVADRDAVHVAVVAVVAGRDLPPGEMVVMSGGKAVPAELAADAVGVVDPFLVEGPREGQRFWLLVHPGTVRTMRHEWEHPAFPAGGGDAATASREWLEKFIAEHRVGSNRGFNYGDLASVDELVENVVAAKDLFTWGESEWTEEKLAALAWHVETASGKRLPPGHAGRLWFSCSC